MKITPNKPHSVHLRLPDDIYLWLSETADVLCVSVPDVIRMMVSTAKAASDAAQHSELTRKA